jgi:hypothetical protein
MFRAARLAAVGSVTVLDKRRLQMFFEHRKYVDEQKCIQSGGNDLRKLPPDPKR